VLTIVIMDPFCAIHVSNFVLMLLFY